MNRFAAGLWTGVAMAGLVVVGCATTFPWRYYAAHFPDRTVTPADSGKRLSDLCYAEGALWGKSNPNGWPDLPMEDCRPDPQPSPGVHLRCVTTFVDDFYAIKADDERCHSDLQKCQQGPPPHVESLTQSLGGK